MREFSMTVTLVAALALARCSDGVKEVKGEKGDVGEKGEPGPAGPSGEKGEKGDTGAPGTAFRVVSPQSSIASCNGDEIMISAYCSGTFNSYPLVPLTNGARCGNNPNSTTLRVTIVCAKR
jgi:Collagen triple helix repeat (20 copies)